jgi:hypothetical protein
MDFVAIWKASSIVITGGFGVLGLLTEFKDKHTKKITKWGRASLTGIIATTLLGAAAQMKESSDDAAKALTLARSSDMTLRNIQKQLHVINRPRVAITLKVPCEKDVLSKFCSSIQKSRSFGQIPVSTVRPWPNNLKVVVNIAFYTDVPDKEKYDDYESTSRFGVLYTFEPTVLHAVYKDSNGSCRVAFEGEARTQMSNGTVKSLLDLPKTLMRVEVRVMEKESNIPVQFFPIDAFQIDTADGELINLADEKALGSERYTYHFSEGWNSY